jgi:hypothetical protein
MAKPTDVPTWATDANYPAGPEPEAGTPTKVEPLAGKQAIGWRPSEYPPAQYLNWAMNLAGQWAQYLNDGALDGDHSIDGNLEVTGDITVGGTIHFTSQRTIRIPAAAAAIPPAYATDLQFEGSKLHFYGPGPVAAVYPIQLRAGEHIKGVLVFVNKVSNASTFVTAELQRIETDGTVVPISSDSSNANAPGVIALAITGLDVEVGVDADATYQVVVSTTVGGGATFGDDFTTCEVDVTDEG